ncbi:MAG TPA: hybrid sensor histidine kinase/response regulator [Candidatus Limnocylindrales bacterium]|nr:hybrid sensor histidine kinase/response regulator [Candidatus Limnocylindrales bacterium]
MTQGLNKSEIAEIFLVEAGEHIQVINDGLLALEANSENIGIVDEIFRSAHTIKGSAAMLGFNVVSKLAHKMEDLLGKIRSQEIKPTEPVITLLLQSIDALASQVENISNGTGEDDSLIPMFEDQYREFLESDLGTGTPVEVKPSTFVKKVQTSKPELKVEIPPSELKTQTDSKSAPTSKSLVAPSEKQFAKVNINDLNKLMNLVGALVINQNRLDQHISYLNKVSTELNFSKAKLLKVIRDFKEKYEYSLFRDPNGDAETWRRGDTETRRHGDAETQRHSPPSLSPHLPTSPHPEDLLNGFSELEFDKYDDFNILSRSLIEIGSDISEIIDQLNNFFEAFEVESSQVRSTTEQLQEGLTNIRMVPVSNLFNRFHRPVRDVSKEEGKEVVLITAGEETRLDKTVIEEMADPLMHLVRNAVSHGIEPPDVREKLGKPRVGTISLNAYQQGSQIIIEIRDDGAGMNPQKLRETAVKKGIKSQAEVDRLSDPETYQLIFLPGFSTKEKVTSVSGRGVGMDVVKTNLTKLGGSIDIKSEPGKGTLFVIKLPLTLIIYQALLVRVGGQEFAIPLNSVEETLRVTPNQIHVVTGQEVIRIRDQILTFIRLNKLLQLSEVEPPLPEGSSKSPYLPVIILGSVERKIAVKVDELIGQQLIVIKPLGDYLKRARMFSGATISGEGAVRLILDASYILETVAGQAEEARPWIVGNEPEIKEGKGEIEEHEEVLPDSHEHIPEVLIADDSISIRKVVSHFLNQAGYTVQVAHDGLEAWNKLNSPHRFDLLITDLEMPKMHGYELIAKVRSKPELQDLPIIVLTSRAGEKHYQKAIALGANDYLVKPFDDRKLLESVQKLLQSPVTLSR